MQIGFRNLIRCLRLGGRCKSRASKVSTSGPLSCMISVHSPWRNRLAYVVRGVCVLRYDNEAGKGDHRHFGSGERPYVVEFLLQAT